MDTLCNYIATTSREYEIVNDILKSTSYKKYSQADCFTVFMFWSNAILILYIYNVYLVAKLCNYYLIHQINM